MQISSQRQKEKNTETVNGYTHTIYGVKVSIICMMLLNVKNICCTQAYIQE